MTSRRRSPSYDNRNFLKHDLCSGGLPSPRRLLLFQMGKSVGLLKLQRLERDCDAHLSGQPSQPAAQTSAVSGPRAAQSSTGGSLIAALMAT
jgi:hypothetical protein